MRSDLKTFRRATLVLAAGAALVPAMIFAVERITFQPGFNLYSPATDIELGRQNSAQADKELKLVSDPEVVNYVNQLGKELVRHEPLPADYPWTFKVVNSRDINAFAFPGGFIYVNRGAIEAAEDEAQLAGVLAHESGHVVMRHGTHMATQLLFAQGGLALLGSLLGQSPGALTDFAKLGISFGVSSMLLHNSREAESQADAVGTYVLYHSGYDPRAMAQFFDIIEKKYPQRTIQFFSDHPVPENRIKAVDAEIPELGPPLPGGGKTDSPEFEAVKQRLLGMPPPSKAQPARPPSQPSGSPSLADVLPSATLRRYEGSTFSISYPDNWRVFSGSGSSVTLAPQAGVSAANISYGVIVNQYRPTAGAAKSLDVSLQQLVNDLRRQNSDLKTAGRVESLQVGGVPARAMDLGSSSVLLDPAGKPLAERDRLVAVQRTDGSLLYVIFVAPERDYPRLETAFDQMVKSLQVR